MRCAPIFEGSPNHARSRGLRAVLLLAAAALLPATSARGDETLDPKTYTSPNGTCTVSVNPSSPEGSGPATYTVKRGDKELWSGKKPFTLWEAVVTDDGIVAGYGYEHGLDGRIFDGADSKTSYFYSVIIDPSGAVRLKDQEDRHEPNVWSDPPSPLDPVGLGVLADVASDRFVVRVKPDWESKDERWKVFKLSTGEAIATLTPGQPGHTKYGFHRAIRCEMVPGTPLVLFQWFNWDAAGDEAPKAEHNSARMAILSLDGNELWKLDVAGEYASFGKQFSWYWDLVRPGIVQSGVGAKSFWFHSFALKSRVRFSVTEDAAAPGGWRVTETAREEAGPPGPAEQPGAGIEAIERAPLGVIHLQDGVPGVAPAPLHGLIRFAMGTDGRLGFIRRDGGLALVLAEADGKVVLERDLAAIGAPPSSELTPLPRGRWLVSTSGLGGEKPSAWTLDPGAANPDFQRLKALDVGALRDVAALPDSGFVAISGRGWAEARALTAFDAEGRARWSADCSSPEGLAVTTDGRIALLEGIVNRIRVFSLDGQEHAPVDLARVLGRRPNYVAGLSPDRDGGLLLYDFNGSPPVERLAKGLDRSLAGVRPTNADGSAFRMVGLVEASPIDGRLWACAAEGVMRLGDDGKADLTLGEAASGAGRPLRRINALAVSHDGKIYAVNGADGAVHVFDSNGALVRRLRPDPGDFVDLVSFGSITVQGDGSVAYYPSPQFSGGGGSYFVRFGPDGNRIEKAPGVLGEVREEWHAVPGTSKRWAVGYTSIALVDERGQILKRIDRRPDSSWLGVVSESAATTDGGVVVIAGPRGMGSRGPAFACVYDRDGVPLKTIPVPVDTVHVRVASNGRTVAITSESDVYLFPIAGGASKRFALPKAEGNEAWWSLLSSPDGKELWALRTGTVDIVRYSFE